MPQLSNSSPAHLWAQSCSSSRSCRVKSVVGKPQRQEVPARADSGNSCGDGRTEGSRRHRPRPPWRTLPLPPAPILAVQRGVGHSILPAGHSIPQAGCTSSSLQTPKNHPSNAPGTGTPLARHL